MCDFAFGVRYRFVSGDGLPETEAAVPVVPVVRSVADEGGDWTSSIAWPFRVWG